MFLLWFDELVWFFDAVIPGDLLRSYVVVGIPELPGAQVQVICVEYI